MVNQIVRPENLKIVWLANIASDQDRDVGMSILEKLLLSGIYDLYEFNISENASWFKDEAAFQLIIDYLKKQNGLSTLYLNQNKFEGAKLTRMLTTIEEMANPKPLRASELSTEVEEGLNAPYRCSTIKKLYMNGCNW